MDDLVEGRIPMTFCMMEGTLTTVSDLMPTNDDRSFQREHWIQLVNII